MPYTIKVQFCSILQFFVSGHTIPNVKMSITMYNKFGDQTTQNIIITTICQVH